MFKKFKLWLQTLHVDYLMQPAVSYEEPYYQTGRKNSEEIILTNNPYSPPPQAVF